MGRVIAQLGPTNTGKTHRALTRMREHETGMIGLPLRLLAREVFERLVHDEGQEAVALVTGEEKRIPRCPRFWVCTVEAMPLDITVDFLAVDEIQLAGHAERGHVFTDRLLHARGLKETWFLGSDAMAQLIQNLLPDTELRRSPRLSTLRSAGATNLGGLPRRSALVAFSARRVYELAERIKARRGGVAIVLGALSPRARNSQVAMYQSGEVDYLVATDAIGMGLNLDLDHVAFSETRKFDGDEMRPLDIGELSQIAGRAGRYQNDGTFGTLNPQPPLHPQIERAVEEHRIPSLRRLVWRSSELDFSTPTTLLHSLDVASPDPRLSLVHYAEDSATLQHLAEDPNVAPLAKSETQVRLLWDLCQIPDYRQLLIEQHARLIGDLFVRLARNGIIDSETLRSRIEPLRQHHGDIDSITARISFIRTWTYVCNREDWVDDAKAWQERTRAIEDELSDALHNALVDSFVDRKKRGRARPAQGADAKSAHVRQLAALKAKLEGRVSPKGPSFGERLATASFEELVLEPQGRILFEGRPVGCLQRGPRICQPRVRVELPDEVAQEQAAVRARLRDFERQIAATGIEKLRSALTEPSSEASAAARGIVYQLEQGLGTAVGAAAIGLLDHLREEERQLFERNGVALGRRSVFVKRLFAQAALQRRRLLVRVALDGPIPGQSARSEHISFALLPQDVRRDEKELELALAATGFLRIGSHALRADVVEKLVGLAADNVPVQAKQLCALANCSQENAIKLAKGLGLDIRSPKKQRRRRRAKPSPQ